MKRLVSVLLPGLILLFPGVMSSCIDDDDEDYSTWKADNDKYVEQMASLTNPDGSLYFEKVTPDWSTGTTVLMHWYNDRQANPEKIKPLFNSWTKVKYRVTLYDGTPVDSSYLKKDSVYVSRPGSNIVGWQIAVMNMHPGDSCRVVMPAASAYGKNKNGAVLPYSALVYDLKLVGITAYEIPK